MRRALALAAACLSVTAAAAPRAAGAPEVGVASSLEKLRPNGPVPRARSIDLVAARGECEAAQIAVRAPGGLAALSAEAGPLRGGSGAALPLALYRVATLSLSSPSGPDGEAGEWPDPLVPVRDAYAGEARRAFPIAVAPGRLQGILGRGVRPGGRGAG